MRGRTPKTWSYRRAIFLALEALLASACTRPINDWHYQSLLHPPAIAFSPLSGPYSAGGSVTLSWTLTALNTLPTQNFNVEVSPDGGQTWQFVAEVPVSTSSKVSSYPYLYTWTAPSWNTTQAIFHVSYVDSLGISGEGTTAAFTVDSISPTINSGQFLVNGLSATSTITTTSNYFTVSMSGADNLTNITHYCFKYYNATTPSLTDSCWIAVNAAGSFYQTPAITLNLSNYPYNVGFITGSYTVKAWVRDAAGNISSNSASLGTDTAQILFVQYPPPTLINSTATSVDLPSSPLTGPQLTVAAGSTLYIKWNASAGTGTTLTSNPISIYTTTDDLNYTLVASNLTNTGQGGCTVTASMTGCYAWTPGNLSTSYFRVRVTAQDVNGQVTAQSTPPINVSSVFSFLAGNVDPGLNASATAAMFFDYGPPGFSDSTTFVIDSYGDVFFRDIYRGILKVNPSDGIQRVFIPMTGVSSGDGGPATSATVAIPYKLAIDGSNRLVIYDKNLIRRVDLNLATPTITTIVGGGASTGDGVTGTNVQITSPGVITGYYQGIAMPFAALPNGDIYFQSENYLVAPTTRIRHYQDSTGTVDSIYYSGVGFNGYPAQDVTLCALNQLGIGYDFSSLVLTTLQGFVVSQLVGSCAFASNGSFVPIGFDQNTGAAWTGPYLTNGYGMKVTGNDGTLYANAISRIGKYNVATATWTNLVGTGTRGSCVDGTLATACNINAQDIFVNSQGQLFFMDSGRLRVVDPGTNQVITLMGQAFFFGDGGDALSARFQFTDSFDLLNSGDVIVLDRGTYRFRQFTPGGSISTIAGNGTYTSLANTGTVATSQGIYPTSNFYSGFVADPTNGDIYYARGPSNLARLDHTSHLWVDTVGSGSTNYTAGDTQIGSTIGGFAQNTTIGFDGSNILVGLASWGGANWGNTYLKTFDTTNNYTQGNVAGIMQASNASTSYCAAGTAQASCGVPLVTVNSSSNLFNTYDSFGARWALVASNSTSVIGMPAGGPTVLITTLAQGAASYTYVHDAVNNIVYYCGNTDKKLHKKDINAGTDTVYNWPVSGMQCTGSRLIYNASSSQLIFPFILNGLNGLATYNAP